MLPPVEPQETEVVAKANRRSFSAKYKREIVRPADACKELGEIGVMRLAWTLTALLQR